MGSDSDETYSIVEGPEGEKLKALDMEFEVEESCTHVYQLEDGTRLEIQFVPMKVMRTVDENGEIVYNENGEPRYTVRHSVKITTHVPEELLDFEVEEEAG